MRAACGHALTPRPPCLARFTATCTHTYGAALIGFASPDLKRSDLQTLAACGLAARVQADGVVTRPRSAAAMGGATPPPPPRRLLAAAEVDSISLIGESKDNSRVGEEPFDSLAAATAALDVPTGGEEGAGRPASGAPRALPAAVWNLDCLDSRSSARDGAFTPSGSAFNGGAGVTVYHLDTGVATGHREFGGRASLAADLTGGDGGDADGHGTHTASTAIGALVGLAPAANLQAYRVLDGGGAGRVSALVAALDAIIAARRATPGGVAAPPGVALMSLGTPAADPRRSAEADAVRAAVRALVATNVTVIAAAGNGGPADDACGRLPAALAGGGPSSGVLAVAAADLEDKFEVDGPPRRRARRRSTPPYAFSSTGRCVSVWAPGVDVLGACGAAERCADPGSGRAYTFASGSSMAAPHVAGAAALFLGANPGATPAEVVAWVLGRASGGAVEGAGRGRDGGLAETTGRLLYVGDE